MELLWILLALAAFPVCIGRAADRARARPPERRGLIDTGPNAPCWTEEISRDDRYLYARSRCVNDALMELDERARRGGYPFDADGTALLPG